MQVNWTEIALGAFTLLSTCGWFVSGRKHKQEVELLKTDVSHRQLDLSTEFAAKFNQLIGKPLETELIYLRNEVKRLTNAIEKVNDCPLRSDCPVDKQLHESASGDKV